MADQQQRPRRPKRRTRIGQRLQFLNHIIPASRAAVLNQRHRLNHAREDIDRDHAQFSYDEIMLVDTMERVGRTEHALTDIEQQPDTATLARIYAELRDIRIQQTRHVMENQLRVDEFRALLDDWAEYLGRISDAARRFSDGLGSV